MVTRWNGENWKDPRVLTQFEQTKKGIYISILLRLRQNAFEFPFSLQQFFYSIFNKLLYLSKNKSPLIILNLGTWHKIKYFLQISDTNKKQNRKFMVKQNRKFKV